MISSIPQWENFKRIIRDFPFTVLSGLTFSIVGWFFVQYGHLEGDKNSIKIVLAASLGIALFTGISLVTRQIKRKITVYLLIVLSCLILVSYYLFTPEFLIVSGQKNGAIRFTLLLFAFVLFVFIAPVLKNYSQNRFWTSLKTMGFRLLMTGFSSIILFIGLMLLLFTLAELLKLNLKFISPPQVWFFIVGIFSVFFFLAGIPENLQGVKKETSYPQIIKVIVQYVLLPLLFLYGIILYFYLGKILITQDWPSGLVALPIIVFSVVALKCHMLLFPLAQNKDGKWVGTFIKVYSVLTIPLALMLFATVSKRMSEYGITEPRYLGIVVSLSLLVFSFYFLLSREKEPLMIPMTLVVLSILASFGPWSAFSVSEASQVNRLKNILEQEYILKNGKIENWAFLAAKNTLPSEQKRQEITSIINYLLENHGVDKIDPWFQADFKNTSLLTYENRSKVRSILFKEMFLNEDAPSTRLGSFLTVVDPLIPNNAEPLELDRYVFRANLEDAAIDSEGYERFFEFSLYPQKESLTLDIEESQRVLLTENLKNGSLTISLPDRELLIFDLRSELKKLKEEYPLEEQLSVEKLTFTAENDQMKAKLVVRDINLQFDANNPDAVNNFWINGIVFISIKK